MLLLIFNNRSRMKKKRRFLRGSESKDSDGISKSETKSISEVVSVTLMQFIMKQTSFVKVVQMWGFASSVNIVD